MRDIDELILSYRDPFREYLHSHFSVVWAIYIFSLVAIVLISYYLVFFNKSDRQKQITLRSIIILNIVVAIVSVYEILAPSRTSLWDLVRDGAIALMVVDLLYYLAQKTMNKHLSLCIVLFIFCLLAFAVFFAGFVLVEIIPIIKPMGSGLLA